MMDRSSEILMALASGPFNSVARISLIGSAPYSKRGVVMASLLYDDLPYRAMLFSGECDSYSEWKSLFSYLSAYKISPFADIKHLSSELRLPNGDEIDIFLVRDDYKSLSPDNETVNNLLRWIECSPIAIENLDDELLGEDSFGRAVITEVEQMKISIESDTKEVDGSSSYDLTSDYLSGYFCSDRYIALGGWSEGRLVMFDTDSGLLGVVSDSEKEITDFIYSDITDYYECLAAVNLNDRWGVIDRDGEFVITAEYDDIELMWEVNHIKYQRSGLYGLFARDLSIICDAKYRYIGSFSCGFALVEFSDGGHNYIDIYGDHISELRYQKASPFVDGLAQVTIGSRECTIDCQGVEI